MLLDKTSAVGVSMNVGGGRPLTNLYVRTTFLNKSTCVDSASVTAVASATGMLNELCLVGVAIFCTGFLIVAFGAMDWSSGTFATVAATLLL